MGAVKSRGTAAGFQWDRDTNFLKPPGNGSVSCGLVVIPQERDKISWPSSICQRLGLLLAAFVAFQSLLITACRSCIIAFGRQSRYVCTLYSSKRTPPPPRRVSISSVVQLVCRRCECQITMRGLSVVLLTAAAADSILLRDR